MGIEYNSDIIGKNYYIDLYNEAIKSSENLAKIKNEKLEFPEGRKISSLFKDFLIKTLEKDYSKRINLREALNHPWIKASKAIFDEKENLGCLENFLIKLITDGIANFNELIK